MNVQQYNAIRAQEQQIDFIGGPATDSYGRRMQGAGKVSLATCYYSVRPAAGETLVVDVKMNGVSVLTAVLTLTNASPVGPATATLSLDAAQVSYVNNDLITIDTTYTAGGGPAMVLAAYRVQIIPG